MSQTNLTPRWERKGDLGAERRRSMFNVNLVEVAALLARLGSEMPPAQDLTPQAVPTRIDRLDTFTKICREELLPVRAGDGDTDAAELPDGAPPRVSSLRTLTRSEEYQVATAGAAVLPNEGDIR